MIFLLPLLIDFSISLAATAQQCGNGDNKMTSGTNCMDRNVYYIRLQICRNGWTTVGQRESDGDCDASLACRLLGLVYAGSMLN